MAGGAWQEGGPRSGRRVCEICGFKYQNDKCSMINDKCSGFALITVMFMLVTLISVVFLAAYPLVSQPRNDTRQFITDLRTIKVKQAMFGRLANQRGGKFMSCGGYYSDYGVFLCSVGNFEQDPLFTKRGHKSRVEGHVTYICRPYQYYKVCGFWGGYRGKRYHYMLPSDDWDESQLAYHDGFGNKYVIKGGCAAAEPFNDFHSHRKNWMQFETKLTLYVKLKDYTNTPEDNFRLVIIRVNNGKTTLIELSHKESERLPSSSYSIHTFYKELPKGNCDRRAKYRMGLGKLVIQTLENGIWVTKYTTPIVIPGRYRCTGREVINCFTEEIDYYE
jgi:hypothetical protein